MARRAHNRALPSAATRSRTWKVGARGRRYYRRKNARLDFLKSTARFLDRFYPSAHQASAEKSFDRVVEQIPLWTPLARPYYDDHLRVRNTTLPPVSKGILCELLLAFGQPGAIIILGAGASAPHVPTTDGLVSSLACFSRRPHHVVTGRKDSSLARLFSTLADDAFARGHINIEELIFFHHQAAASLALLWGQIFEKAWTRPPEQYRALRLFSRGAKIITFNFEGFERGCPQEVIPVHNRYFRRPLLSDRELAEIHATLQLFDESDGKAWIGPVILPGEESSESTKPVRDRVFKLLLHATVVVIIGYRFGLGAVGYDRVWLELFVEAMRANACSIHVIDPDAQGLCARLAEEINLKVNLFPWPLRWNAFANVLLQLRRELGVPQVLQLLPEYRRLLRRYEQTINAEGA